MAKSKTPSAQLTKEIRKIAAVQPLKAVPATQKVLISQGTRLKGNPITFFMASEKKAGTLNIPDPITEMAKAKPMAVSDRINPVIVIEDLKISNTTKKNNMFVGTIKVEAEEMLGRYTE
jgi:hypothetical protein